MRVRAAGTPSQSPLKASLYLGRAVLALALAYARTRHELVGRGVLEESGVAVKEGYGLALVGALVAMGLIVELLRRRQLTEKYAVIWLAVGLGIVVLAARPSLLSAAVRTPSGSPCRRTCCSSSPGSCSCSSACS